MYEVIGILRVPYWWLHMQNEQLLLNRNTVGSTYICWKLATLGRSFRIRAARIPLFFRIILSNYILEQTVIDKIAV